MGEKLISLIFESSRKVALLCNTYLIRINYQQFGKETITPLLKSKKEITVSFIMY